MRILIVTPHFWPELFRVTELASDLRAREHEVEVLTGLPNYPAGRFFDGYGISGPYEQERDGVRVHRAPVVPRGRGGAFRLALNYASFALTATLRALPLALRRRDVIFVFGISPVTAIIPAVLLRALRGTPIVIWIQDLWPESIASAGFARIPGLYRAAGALSGWLYRHCDRILGTSRAFQPSLEDRGVPSTRYEYLPQWAEEVFDAPVVSEGTPDGAWSNGFPLVFAGNLGRVQGLDTLLDTAELLRDEPEVRWIFLGDGSRRGWLEAEVERRGLTESVYLLGRRPVSEMPGYYARAAAMIVSLQRDDTMALTVPAKLQSYLAAGRPILGSIDGEAAKLIEESGAGWAAPAGRAPELARIVRRMKSLSTDEREAMGRSGREYSKLHFSRDLCLEQLERALRGAASSRRP